MLIFVQRDGFVAEQLECLGRGLVGHAFKFSAFSDDQIDPVAIRSEFKKVLSCDDLDRPAGLEMSDDEGFQFGEFAVVVENAEANVRQPA